VPHGAPPNTRNEPTKNIWGFMVFETTGLHLGAFDLHGLKVFGQLHLASAQSRLTLRTEDKPARLDVPSVVNGQLHDFTWARQPNS